MNPDALQKIADEITNELLPFTGLEQSDDEKRESSERVLRHLPPESEKLPISGSISPILLHKALTILDQIQKSWKRKPPTIPRSPSAPRLVKGASNLRFEPEIGVTKPNKRLSF
jgi:hypothetical protein